MAGALRPTSKRSLGGSKGRCEEGRSKLDALKDPRRPDDGPPRREVVTSEDLRAPLPTPSPLLTKRRCMQKDDRPGSALDYFLRLCQNKARIGDFLMSSGKFLSAVCALDCLQSRIIQEVPKMNSAPMESHPRRWYRVDPIPGKETFFVRPSVGIRDVGLDVEESLGSNSMIRLPAPLSPPTRRLPKLCRSRSVPAEIDRRIGTSRTERTDNTLVDSTCKICFDRASCVVVLPCRHGGMCEQCLRSSLYRLPEHRGGRTCPLCRKPVKEVVRISEECRGHGYAIRHNSFMTSSSRGRMPTATPHGRTPFGTFS